MVLMLIGIFILSWSLTLGIRRYALANNIMDCPNHRSSHTTPTPRGGGLAFVTTFLIPLPLLAFFERLTTPIACTLFGAGLLTAFLGFLDDRRPIAAHWRLLGHFLVCTLAVFCMGGLPALSFFGYLVPVNMVMNILAVFYLIWLLNLYNFMDGIDGLAGVEAVSVCLCMAFIYQLKAEPALMLLPLLLAASVAGFLCWNLPPARIFMGDAGSGFLGLMLGLLSIQAAWCDSALFWSWLILLGAFIVDATMTLFIRMFRHEKVHEAHRNHAYQHATRCFGRHLPVTLAIGIINVLWLFPCALLVGLEYLDGLTGVLIGYAPLVILASQFKAGRS